MKMVDSLKGGKPVCAWSELNSVKEMGRGGVDEDNTKFIKAYFIFVSL